jgi:hypothetical protein
MKSLNICYFGVFILFLSIAFTAGCMGAVKTTPESPSIEPVHSIPSTSLVGVSPSPNAITSSCPLPKLIFNDSQEITKFGQGNGLRFIGQNTSSNSEPGTVPYKGVVYHDVGFTRIFDSTGKQILFVNDSDSMTFIPAGFSVPGTYVNEIKDNMYPIHGEDNITYIYESGGVETCIATIIYIPGSFKSPDIPPH